MRQINKDSCQSSTPPHDPPTSKTKINNNTIVVYFT